MKLIPIEIARLEDDISCIWKKQLKSFTKQKISKKKVKYLIENKVDFFIEKGIIYSYGQRFIGQDDNAPYYKITLQDNFEKEIWKKLNQNKKVENKKVENVLSF